jgi:hypothetical protein
MRCGRLGFRKDLGSRLTSIGAGVHRRGTGLTVGGRRKTDGNRDRDAHGRHLP